MKVKEFFKRWKAGIEGITPFQQVKTQMNGTMIMLLGITCGLVICLFNLKNLWWLFIILLGGLFNTSVQLLSQYQIYLRYKIFYKEGENVG